MLRVFEAFAGYGSQRMALQNIGVDFEVVGISEIDPDVLLSYAAIHTDYLKKRKPSKLKDIDLANKMTKNFGEIFKEWF